MSRWRPLPSSSRASFGAVVVVLSLLNTLGCLAADKTLFNRDIRPILSDKCFHCHGFDPKNRKGDLRLDDREAAIEALAIVPGKANESTIVERMESHDPDDQMPPPKSKLPRVTPEEIAVVKQWINEGAKYEGHWAFIPVGINEPGTSIDGIVAAGLKERGLTIQEPAAAATLARRLSLDLTGLPPSPERVSRFVLAHQSDAAAAVAAYASELLASPHYGERMAVDWLDISRYADSYGFQVDRDREVWMWRDWVVKAFNDNLPFDQFVTWQIAGDMLPAPTEEQRLATAFCRLHQQESEGGSVEEEYRVEYVADRVQTFATAFLGLTFECSRCHDHKYDPISQKDYYALFSMFQNIDEAGLYSFFTDSTPSPALMLMPNATKAKMTNARAKVAALEGKIVGAPTAQLTDADFAKALVRYPFDEIASGRKLAGIGDPKDFETLGGMLPAPKAKGKTAKNAAKNPPAGGSPGGDAAAVETVPSLDGVIAGENKLIDGRDGKAILFSGDDPVDLPIGNFNRHDPFSISLWMKTPDRKERAVVFHRSRAWMDAASRGYELLIEEGRLKWSLIHFWPGNSISVRTQKEVPTNEWVQVVVTNDGSSRASGLRIYVNGQRAETKVIRDNLTKGIAGGGKDTISLGERFRDRGFKGGVLDDFRVYPWDLSQPLDAAFSRELQEARAEVTRLADATREIMTMEELPQPKTAYILFRGEYDKRREPVTAQTPAVLGLLGDDVPKNRLSLARWLTDRQHPLFARVTVNRIWQNLFGRGLVKTAEDFGSQGERPLYPELLDYLSARLMDGGWNVKALIQEIVTSRVYLQRSIADAKTMADDPENQWLARGPRFRLPAEMIRDNALSAAGLIQLAVGGPPINSYEMTEAFKPATVSGGTGPYRRSIYANWRRTSPPPAMTTFDAPKRSVCAAKRDRTDSPLQALILMNGVQYVEAARVLGETVFRDSKGDVPQMIEAAFLRCMSRKPDAREIAICTQLYQEQLGHYRENAKDAEALLKHGLAPRDATVPLAEAAATTILAQALLSHDECVVKR